MTSNQIKTVSSKINSLFRLDINAEKYGVSKKKF